MTFTTSRLVPLRIRSGLPILIKGIIIRVGSGAQFALWLISTPSLLMIKQLRNLVFSLVEHGMRNIPWFKKSFRMFSLSSYSLSFLKPSLALLVPAPFFKPNRAKALSTCDERFVALQKSPPKNKTFFKASKRPDKIYDQVLLNSAIRRYRKFLISLSSSQLINLYRASYFRHAKYYPPASLLQLCFEEIKLRGEDKHFDSEPIIEQLLNQALGRGFLNPQAIYYGWTTPLLRPLPPAEALKFINEKLDFYQLLS